MLENSYLYIYAALGIVVPVTIIRRLLKNGKGALINPLLYLLIFAYLYLLVPSFYIEWILVDLYDLGIGKTPFLLSQYLCLWHLLVFYIFYLLSRDHIVIRNGIKVYDGVYKLSLVVYSIIVLLLLWIIVYDVPHIYVARADRGAALDIYYARVLTRYKIVVVIFIMLAATTVLIIQKQDLKFLAPLLLFCVIDYSHGGRTLTFIVFIFSYIQVVLITGKLYIKYAVVALLLMIFVGLFQRSDMSTMLGSLYMTGAEFSNTRITTSVVIAHPDVRGDFWQYMLICISRILPGGPISKILNPTGTWYGEIVSAKANIGFGLSGNIVTESIYYGGIYFGFISPIIIGGLYYLLNYLKVYKNLIGFIFIIFISTKSQDIMRTYFYDNFLYLFGLEILYAFFVLFEYRKKFFV